ncbi:MAG: DUF2842 domain-containing protein [Roseococcus sp.]|nr:DUF2842 domain-containing protein [Roseococcus sp.]
MQRTTLAFLIGAVGFVAYIVMVATIGDFFVRQHWALQLVYYVAAGVVWVFPARRLLLWGAARRRD